MGWREGESQKSFFIKEAAWGTAGRWIREMSDKGGWEMEGGREPSGMVTDASNTRVKSTADGHN